VQGARETVGVVPHSSARRVLKQSRMVYASTLLLELPAVDLDGRGFLRDDRPAVVVDDERHGQARPDAAGNGSYKPAYGRLTARDVRV
jgi:hypothetical protein